MKMLRDASKRGKQSVAQIRTGKPRRKKTLIALASAASATAPLLFVQSPAVAILGPTDYFQGSISNTWSATSGGNTNFTTDAAGTTISTTLPNNTTSVVFYAQNATTGNLNSVLGSNFTINSLTMEGTSLGESSAASIASGGAGNNSLTLSPASSSSGITVFTGAGALTVSASVVLGAPQTWSDVSSNENLLVSGNITGSSGDTLTIAGNQTVLLSGPSDTYSGATTVSGGNLTINGSVTNSNISVHAGATLSGNGLVGGSISLNGGAITATGLTVTGAINFNSTGNTIQAGTVTASSGVTVGSTGALTVSGTVLGSLTVNPSGTLTGGGVVSSTLSLYSATVTGSGMRVGGPMTVNGAGNLIAGTIGVPSGVTVASAAVLNLSGNLTGPLILSSSSTMTGGGVLAGGLTVTRATVMPGTASVIGKLTTGDAGFSDGSTLSINLDSDNASTSLLSSNGNVTLGTGGDSLALLSVTDLGVDETTLTANTILPIITTTGTVTGQFNGLAEGAPVSVVNGGSNVYTIDYESNAVDLIANTATPEPTSLGLLGMGTLVFLARRPRKSITLPRA